MISAGAVPVCLATQGSIDLLDIKGIPVYEGLRGLREHVKLLNTF